MTYTLTHAQLLHLDVILTLRTITLA